MFDALGQILAKELKRQRNALRWRSYNKAAWGMDVGYRKLHAKPIGAPKQKGPVPTNGSFESYKAKTIQQPLRLPLQPWAPLQAFLPSWELPS